MSFTTYELQEVITSWQSFLTQHTWEFLIQDRQALKCGCGLVYELPNYLQRPNESFAIADMRNLDWSEPHYHIEKEVYFILQGSGLVVMGSEQRGVAKGDVIVIPSNIAHFVIPTNDLIIAVVNTPPFDINNYQAVAETNHKVGFDAEQFAMLKLQYTVKTIKQQKGSYER